MFAAQHDNPPCLRQGDVIENVFFPLTRPASLKYLATYVSGSGTNIVLEPFSETPQGSRRQYLQGISHGVVAHGAILSQCCDLDTKHPRTSFSLCRLIPFERTRYKNVDALINNIDPWGQENPHYQFFYFGKIDGLDGEYLADFALLTSFGWSDYEFILRKKVCQLDDLNRNKFRVKVGAFFGRPTEEDTQAGLGNPYEPTAPIRTSLLKRLRSFFNI
jgi:hypothetical protein